MKSSFSIEYVKGGQASIRQYWRHYFENADVLVSLLNHLFDN
jgi:hypothetical protein